MSKTWSLVFCIDVYCTCHNESIIYSSHKEKIQSQQWWDNSSHSSLSFCNCMRRPEILQAYILLIKLVVTIEMSTQLRQQNCTSNCIHVCLYDERKKAENIIMPVL